MFDVICVPVDGSEYGYKAADVAIELAQKFSSKIAAVHVLEEFSFSSYDEEEDSEIDLSSIRYAADRCHDKIRFTDEALQNFVKTLIMCIGQ